METNDNVTGNAETSSPEKLAGKPKRQPQAAYRDICWRDPVKSWLVGIAYMGNNDTRTAHGAS